MLLSYKGFFMKFIIKWYRGILAYIQQRNIRKRIKKNDINWEKKIRGVV